jgi:hypothetical protein
MSVGKATRAQSQSKWGRGGPFRTRPRNLGRRGGSPSSYQTCQSKSSPVPGENPPQRLFFREQLLPLLVDFSLDLELNLAQLEHGKYELWSMLRLLYLLLLPAELLLLETHALRRKVFRQDGRIAAMHNEQVIYTSRDATYFSE